MTCLLYLTWLILSMLDAILFCFHIITLDFIGDLTSLFFLNVNRERRSMIVHRSSTRRCPRTSILGFCLTELVLSWMDYLNPKLITHTLGKHWPAVWSVHHLFLWDAWTRQRYLRALWNLGILDSFFHTFHRSVFLITKKTNKCIQEYFVKLGITCAIKFLIQPHFIILLRFLIILDMQWLLFII